MKLREILEGWRDGLALLLAVLLSLVLMNSANHPSAERFRNGLGQVVSVFTTPFTLIPRTVTVWGQNAALRAELVQLRGEEYEWRDALLENARLRKLLGFRERPDFQYLAGEVIARDPSMNLSGLLLDKGLDDSVKVGQAVVTADGLAGIVISATSGRAVVQLATDRNFSVSARVERSRVDGIVRWAGGYRLRFDDVPKNLDVKAGDRIVTSGLGGVIPGGIPVGRVQKVSKQRGELFQTVTVVPYVSFARLEEVFVLVPTVQDEPETVEGER
ncbi:rod shape-determining protein MreC [bacterium]|nr:rod shape-determining protein MreC [bacterium]